MAATTKDITVFPKGANTFMFVPIGATAGNHVCTGVVLATDVLLQVLAITHSAGVASGVADLTSEFTISANDQINNTGGTTLANKLTIVLVARNAST